MRRTALLLTLTVTVAACGGGGGSDDAATTTEAPATTPPTTQPATTTAPTTTEASCEAVLGGFPAPPVETVRVDRTGPVAAFDLDLWDGDVPEDDEMLIVGSHLYAVDDGVVGRVDLTTGGVEPLDVGIDDEIRGFVAHGDALWVIARGDDTTRLIELDPATGCSVRSVAAGIPADAIAVVDGEFWLAAGSGAARIDDATGEPIEVVDIDVTNQEATGSTVDGFGFVGFCGDLASLDLSTGDIVERELAGGELCLDVWATSSHGVAGVDGGGDEDEPALGAVFPPGRTTVAAGFAVPFEAEHLSVDADGTWVIGTDGEIWRVPAPLPSPVELDDCIELVGGDAPFGFAGQIVDVGTPDPAPSSPLTIFVEQAVTIDGNRIVLTSLRDLTTATIDAPLPVTSVSATPLALWIGYGRTFVRYGPDGCPLQHLTTTVDVDDLHPTFPSAWGSVTGELVSLDMASGQPTDTFADVTGVDLDVASPATSVHSLGQILVTIGECGRIVAINVPTGETIDLPPDRCDLTGWAVGQWGFAAWSDPDAEGVTTVQMYDSDLVATVSGLLPDTTIVEGEAATDGVVLRTDDGRLIYIAA